MAGHSKWANIQHRKKAQDAKRGKVFTKMIREITIAARMGGADPETNSRLRLVVQKAYASNMSRDTVERAIKRGARGLEGSDLVEVRYEGYGPAGVAVMVDCLTNNRNRTVSEVRHAFSKHGGHLGTDGSVAYLFTERGILSFAPGSNEDRIMEIGLEAGAEDIVVNEDKSIDVYTTPELFENVKNAMIAANFAPAHAEVTLLPSIHVALNDDDDAHKMLKMQEMLEDLDDVQNVYTNAEISQEILEMPH